MKINIQQLNDIQDEIFKLIAKKVIVQDTIRPLHNDLVKLINKIDKLQHVIDAFRKVCEHDMVYDDFMSHGHVEIQKCAICGITKHS